MDFFEKAHVTKKQPSKKDTKSEEIVKKQLKQMLQGFKRSDNELIRHSGNSGNDIVEAHKRFDDSASVSGFSDLDLTHSDNEEDIVQASTSRTVDNTADSSSHISLPNSSESNCDTDDNIEDLNLEESNSQESISECDEIVESLSEHIEVSSSEGGDTSFSNLDVPSPTLGSTTDSEVFDPDGELASKILENLKKNELSKIGKKRKVEDERKPIKPKKKDVKHKKSSEIEDNESDDTMITMEALSICEDDNDNENDDEIETISDSNSAHTSTATNESLPFVSITVTDMPEQKINNFLEDYKHPTVRPLQNIVYTATSPALFAPESEPIENMLSSELNDNETVVGLVKINLDTEPAEDIETDDVIENIDLDTSTDQPLEESTAEYDNTLMSDTPREAEEDSLESVKFYYGKNCYVVVLQHPAEIYVSGKVRVKGLGGVVEVYGHILRDAVELYAPNNYFAQCIKTVERPNDDYGLFRKLTAEGLLVREAEEIVTTIGQYDGIISLSRLHDPRMDFVEKNVAMDLFPKSNKGYDSLRKVSVEVGCSLMLKKPWRHFDENVAWELAVNCGFEENSRGIVCGGKGVGKSTFLRYFVNRMLIKGPVLVIDLDPGQAEFTVSGNISATVVTTPLLGPNYTHLKTPEMSLNIGMINTMDNIARYLAAVSQILSHCHSNQAYSSMPWIVNTMGMCTQMGLKFILHTIQCTRPTFLVQIDSQILKKRFESRLDTDSVKSLLRNFDCNILRNAEDTNLNYSYILMQHAQGSDKHNTATSPKELRYLNFLAYFGELMNIHKGTQLLGIVPYEVSMSDVNVLTNMKVANDAVLKVINGKIVALCQLAMKDKGKVFTLQDNALLCHGNGLVRGVDFEKRLLYVVTPVAADKLSAVDTLLYADWVPDLHGPERFLPEGTEVPYRSLTDYRQKQFMQSPRRRFNPLQLLKMSRSA
ncbi:polynucleotide 5'-hydroxyl-kinase NOL9 isoform X2 [Spodoptera litura]|nr:polynucleotide 5'-hydroxyl-kinase NOL9 isoform X2 [Spodoptera litura]